MKLIIQIPCYNEQATLPITLASLPRNVAGFDRVEWLVVDDGSGDGTGTVAAELGVDHIVRHPTNRGLASAFMTGIREALRLGADVIVNIDADNQYNAADIPALLAPIHAGSAGFVIGIRPVDEVRDIPPLIRFLHRLGSIVVMKASGTRITDPPSGFRAFTREVAGNLRVFNRYTYTLETIIQAGNTGIHIEPVAIRINPGKLRPSRLMTSPYNYVARSVLIIFRSLLYYNPPRFMLWCIMPLVVAAAAAAVLQLSGSPWSLVMPCYVIALLLLVLAVVTIWPFLFSCSSFAKPDCSAENL